MINSVYKPKAYAVQRHDSTVYRSDLRIRAEKYEHIQRALDPYIALIASKLGGAL